MTVSAFFLLHAWFTAFLLEALVFFLQLAIVAHCQVQLSGFFQLAQPLWIEILGRKCFLTAAAVVHGLLPPVCLSNGLRSSFAFEASCTAAETPLLLPFP